KHITWFLRLFRKGRYAIESHVGEHRKRRPAQDAGPMPALWVVHGMGEEADTGVRMLEHVSSCGDEEYRHHYPHTCSEQYVDSRGGLYALNIQGAKQRREENCPGPIGTGGKQHVHLLTAEDDGDHRINEIVKHHAPTSHVTRG